MRPPEEYWNANWINQLPKRGVSIKMQEPCRTAVQVEGKLSELNPVRGGMAEII